MLPLFAHSRHIALPPVLVYGFGAIFGKITAIEDVYKRQVPDEPASTGGKEHERIETKNKRKRN